LNQKNGLTPFSPNLTKDFFVKSTLGPHEPKKKGEAWSSIHPPHELFPSLSTGFVFGSTDGVSEKKLF
jgi:hypothetical protein